ncbi:hypothetical protein BGX30_009592, partial [Mortierella sp. GBA39]
MDGGSDSLGFFNKDWSTEDYSMATIHYESDRLVPTGEIGAGIHLNGSSVELLGEILIAPKPLPANDDVP